MMAKPDSVFVYVGTYPSEVAARADYDIVKDQAVQETANELILHPCHYRDAWKQPTHEQGFA